MGKQGDDGTKEVPAPTSEPRGDTNTPDADDGLFLFPLEERADSGSDVDTTENRPTGRVVERSPSDGEAVSLALGRLRDSNLASTQKHTGISSARHKSGKRSTSATDIPRDVGNRLNPLKLIRRWVRRTDDRLASRRRVSTKDIAVESGVQRAVPTLDQGLGEVTRLIESLSALEARAIALSENQSPAVAPAKAVQREHQGTELRVGIDLRLEHDDVQQHRMTQVLGDAARAGDLLSALEARIATLTGLGDTLDRVVRTVENLEGRVGLAAARLDQFARAKSELEHNVIVGQKISAEEAHEASAASAGGQPLDSAGAAATRSRHHESTKKAVLSALSWFRRGVSTFASDRVSPLARKIAPRQRWTTGIERLAACVLISVAVTLLSVAATRLRDRGVAPAGRENPRQTAWFGAASSPLPSRSLPVALWPLPLQSFERRALVGRDSTFDTASRTNRLSPLSEINEPGRPGSGGSTAPREIALSVSRAPSAALFNGMIGVESWPPGAVVFINQRRVGETPLRLLRVSAGSHVVWVEQKGYERWSSSVLVPDGQQIRVRANLLRSH